MASFWTQWLTVLVVGSLAVISPGPSFAIAVRNSLRSRRAGVLSALGMAVGNCVHAAYCVVGIAVLIAQSVLLFNAIKWLGAAYLVWIGLKALRAKPGHGPAASAAVPGSLQPIGDAAAFRSGLFTNLLNPKVSLFFLALFTQIIEPGTPGWAQAVYGATMVALEFLWYGSVALIVTQPRLKARLDAAAHWVERLTGGVLVALGIRLALAKAAG